LLFLRHASDTSSLNYCVIRYGDYGLYCQESDLTISNCTITQSRNDGIYANSCSPTISGGVIETNGRYGVHLLNSPATIEDVEITGSASYGIYCNNSSPSITGNTISGNTYPIGATGNLEFIAFSGNTISDCGKSLACASHH